MNHETINNEKGTSIIEVMVSALLFAVTLSSLALSGQRFMRMNTSMEQKAVGITVAQEVLEGFRQVDPATLPSTGTTTTSITKGNRTYSAATTYCSTSSYCTTYSRHLTVSVSYNGSNMVTVSTVFASLR